MGVYGGLWGIGGVENVGGMGAVAGGGECITIGSAATLLSATSRSGQRWFAHCVTGKYPSGVGGGQTR